MRLVGAAELASANSGKAKDVVETYLKKARVVFDIVLSDVWVDGVDDVKAAACLSDLKTQAKKASRNDGSLLEKVNDAIEQMDTGLSLVLKCRTWRKHTVRKLRMRSRLPIPMLARHRQVYLFQLRFA